tara:strand:+ start:726 stop:902 length:177 start_codon:yes stop_codon:yes gene_type:complete
MINYNNILKENLLETFKKILSNISEKGFSNDQHLTLLLKLIIQIIKFLNGSKINIQSI